MKKARTAPLNMAASLFNQIITVATGLIVQRYILLAYGSTHNGLTSLIAQIISYLILLEAGIGAASIQAFYKPLNDGDWREVSAVMNATAKSYRQVGYIFTACLIGGAFVIPLAAAGEVDFALAAALTIVSGGGNVVLYMISGKCVAFLTSTKRIYVRNMLSAGTTLLSAVLRIVALKNGCGIVFVQSIHLVCIVLSAIILWGYVNKNYPKLDKTVPANMSAINKRWNVLVHSLAGMAVSHTDILVLSIASSLKIVSVYNVYNMVFSHMGTLLQTVFSQALQGNFGRLLDKDKTEFKKIYKVYETAFTVFLFVISTIALIMILPFVKLYTSGITDIQYVDFWLPILFIAIFIFNYIRIPMIVTINSAGTFKETQLGAIIEMVIALTMSLGLFIFTNLGIYGLLIGKICSFFYRTTDVIVYTYRHILKESLLGFLRLLFANIGATVVMALVFYVFMPISATSYLWWIVWAIIMSITTLLVFAIFNFLINFKRTKTTALTLLSTLKLSRKSAKI